MKKTVHYISALMLAAFAFFMVSCEDNDEITVKPDTPDSDFDATLSVFPESDGGKQEKTYNAPSTVPDSLEIKLSFTVVDKKMERLYITKNVQGAGDEPFDLSEIVDIDKKGDGSVNIEDKDKKGFNFKLKLPLDKFDNGTVVYNFWTTKGKGDFRDMSKRLVGDFDSKAGVGCLIIKYGTGVDPDASVKKSTNVTMRPPAADLSSNTFISTYDGKIYAIAETENLFLWDFGYFYDPAKPDGSQTPKGVSFYSTRTYSDNVNGIDLPTAANLDDEQIADLNSTYFKLSTKTAAEFDAVKIAGDLDFITKSDSQGISGLEKGNIVEFVDKYGKKGLIKIIDFTRGYSPKTDYVKIDIKIQP